MVAGKKLTDFTSLFSPCDFKKNDNIKNVISKMNKTSKTNLSEQIKFQLSKIIGIRDYFHQEIDRRKSCSKKLSKYVTASDYIDKILIVLSATSNGVYIILSASWDSKCKFYFNFFFHNRNQEITNHNKKSMIRFLCWLKVNSIALKR